MMDARPLPPPPSLADLMQGGPVALFLDFDGTLIEIAARHDAIVVPSGLSRKLEKLSERLDGRLALVSGRALDDIERHVGACRICQAGSHGSSRLRADGSRLGEEPRSLPEAVMEALNAMAEAEQLELEIKAHGGALHFRSNPEGGDIALARAKELADRHGLAVKSGKSVVELVDREADKGAAVRAFMGEAPFAGARPVFIGDDVTDEDGFAASAALSGFGIAVGERPSQTARFHLETVTAVHDWLDL